MMGAMTATGAHPAVHRAPLGGPVGPVGLGLGPVGPEACLSISIVSISGFSIIGTIIAHLLVHNSIIAVHIIRSSQSSQPMLSCYLGLISIGSMPVVARHA